jgi:uncharacterized Tic20 family protein
MSEPHSDSRSGSDADETGDVAATGSEEPHAPGIPAYGTPPSPSYGPSYGPGTDPGYGGPATTVSDERHWATAAHLSGFVAAYVALGFLGPLVVLLAAGDRSPFIRRHATEALNFNLCVLLYVLVSAVLVLVLIGIPMLVAIGLLYLVTTIQGALAASRGEEYRYPLTIRFIS